jgi:hypothetical protein
MIRKFHQRGILEGDRDALQVARKLDRKIEDPLRQTAGPEPLRKTLRIFCQDFVKFEEGLPNP